MNNTFKNILIYLISFGISSGFPLYALYNSICNTVVLYDIFKVNVIIISLITSILVQVIRDNNKYEKFVSNPKEQIINDIDMISIFGISFVIVVNTISSPIILFVQLIMPTIILLTFLTMITSPNKDKCYYYLHEILHHLLNITFYLTI
jgi:hypothetical protein